jgi:hypothetical protein
MGNNNSIITIVVMIVALFIAVLLGANVGSNDQTTPVIFLSCVVAVGLIFSMGSNLWMLVPVFWLWIGRIGILPLPLTVAELILLFAVVSAAVSLPLGGFRFRNRLTYLDFFLFLVIAELLVVFALNPVGVSAMGSDTVGAKPYFAAFVAFLGYVLISNQQLSEEKATWIPKAVLAGAAVISLGKLLCFLVPAVGYALYPIYSEFIPKLDAGLDASLVGQSRLSFLVDFSQVLLLFLLATASPMKSITPLNPIRFILFAIGVGGLAISGFRSHMVVYGFYFLLAGYFWERWRGVGKLFLIGLVGLLGLFIVHLIHPLPLSIQRSLSFLPGDWDEMVTSDAEGSVEWRIEMWKDTLFTDKVVSNKILGDGFGFSAREMKIFNDLRFTEGGANSEAYQEYYKITGSFHSGPLSAIRYVGYIGLFLFVVAGIAGAIISVNLIKRSWNTPFRLVTIFFSIPWIFHPIYYLFIFGSFDGALPNFIMGVGVLKMLGNTLRAYNEKMTSHQEQSVEGALVVAK